MRFVELTWGLLGLCVGLAACGDATVAEQTDSGASAGSGGAGNNRTMALGYARDDLACSTDADCCIVVDGCLADAYLVRLGDKDIVRGLLDSADKSMCLGCIPPTVQGRCGNTGVCTMVDVTCTGSASPAGIFNDHCGAAELPTGCSVQTQAVPTWPTHGLQPQAVKGCGSGH